MDSLAAERLGFWDERAQLGFAAGSNDTNLKKIEIKALDAVIPRAGLILDAGCGNAHTLAALAESREQAKMIGFDYSSLMVQEGQALMQSKGLQHRVELTQANLLDLDFYESSKSQYECVYTQRSLINLDSFSDQLVAIKSLWSLVKPGGLLVLCESFEDGLAEINAFRESIGLDVISRPWHNSYLTLELLGDIAEELGADHQVIEFSGSYYFVSRVVHAWQASNSKEEPSYSNPVNLMSLDLPAISLCGQSKIVVFSK